MRTAILKKVPEETLIKYYEACKKMEVVRTKCVETYSHLNKKRHALHEEIARSLNVTHDDSELRLALAYYTKD